MLVRGLEHVQAASACRSPTRRGPATELTRPAPRGVRHRTGGRAGAITPGRPPTAPRSRARRLRGRQTAGSAAPGRPGGMLRSCREVIPDSRSPSFHLSGMRRGQAVREISHRGPLRATGARYSARPRHLPFRRPGHPDMTHPTNRRTAAPTPNGFDPTHRVAVGRRPSLRDSVLSRGTLRSLSSRYRMK